mmetsp:Transcript_23930/g.35149  ORF Transcript_23930/g.35149 Transcript_23930/m.35149 type:complete len:429 (+) Transcript_23930:60-1346(+)
MGDSWAEQEDAFFGPSISKKVTHNKQQRRTNASSATTPTIASIPSSSTAAVTTKQNGNSNKWFNNIPKLSNKSSQKGTHGSTTATIAILPPLSSSSQPSIRPPPPASTTTATTSITKQPLPHCVICGTNTSYLTHYKYHPYFIHERMCGTHQNHEMTRCTSCNRIGPSPLYSTPSRARSFIPTHDNHRVLCTTCASTAVTDADQAEAQILWSTVLYFFQIKLQIALPSEMQDIPVLLVGHVYLNEAHGDSGGGSGNFHTRGLCTYTYPPAKVTSVQCLKYLTRSVTGSILAHEATHAWFKLHSSNTNAFVGGGGAFGGGGGGGFSLPPQVEEGCCQLMAFLYLSNEEDFAKMWDKVTPSLAYPESKNGFVDTVQNVELRRYFRHCIEHDTTPIYGDGFRQAKRALEEYFHGCMKDLLEFVVVHRSFPI